MSSTSSLSVEDFGLAEYEAIHRRQRELVDARVTGQAVDTLLIGEHWPVITCGRGSQAEQLVSPTFPVVEIERGGGVTLHAPGQIVAYPIRWLPPSARDLHGVLRALEQAVITTLASFEVQGFRRAGLSGVWANDPHTGRPGKVAAVGVAVRRWVTYHGVALNVNNALADYAQIRPCGLDAGSVTSLATLLGAPVDVGDVKDVLIHAMWPLPFPALT